MRNIKFILTALLWYALSAEIIITIFDKFTGCSWFTTPVQVLILVVIFGAVDLIGSAMMRLVMFGLPKKMPHTPSAEELDYGYEEDYEEDHEE